MHRRVKKHKKQEMPPNNWLLFVRFEFENGVHSVVVNVNPVDFCQIPPKYFWALAPLSPAVTITALGGNEFRLSYIQPGTEYTLEVAYVNSCGQTNHSNVLHFTPEGD